MGGYAAHALELALLQDAQELDLGGRRQLAHLVEKQRAAVRQLETAFLRAGTGEGAASWPNNSLSIRLSGSAPQFTLMKGLAERGEL